MLVNATEAKRRTGLTRYMLERHGPPMVRIGGRIYWRSEDLDAMIGRNDDGRPKQDDLIGRINDLSPDEIR